MGVHLTPTVIPAKAGTHPSDRFGDPEGFDKSNPYNVIRSVVGARFIASVP